MTPQQIKNKLKEKRITQAALAKRWGVARCTVHFLIEGRIKSRRLERNLARLLAVPVEALRAEAPVNPAIIKRGQYENRLSSS